MSEEKYDEEEKRGTPRRLVAWINEVTKDEADPCPGDSLSDLHKAWRDGVALCKLINLLLTSAGQDKVKFTKKIMSPFAAMTNIDAFKAGCVTYGVAETELFDSRDLWDGKKANMSNVLHTLSLLGVEANKKGYEPAFDPGE